MEVGSFLHCFLLLVRMFSFLFFILHISHSQSSFINPIDYISNHTQVCIHGTISRGTPVEDSFSKRTPAAAEKNMVFFHYDDLKSGKTIQLYFPPRDPSKTPQFLPRSQSDSIPFSLRDLPYILRFFNFTQGSPQSTAIEETLAHCESPPIKGEFKYCATSLESMIDGVRTRFASPFRPLLLTTSWVDDGSSGVSRYRVLGDPVEVRASTMVACHAVPYPYAVFYCHGQRKSQYKLFQMEIGREDGVKEERVRIAAMCHMDTSDWNPGHVGFQVLGMGPGDGPVCHMFPPDSLIWIPATTSSPKFS